MRHFACSLLPASILLLFSTATAIAQAPLQTAGQPPAAPASFHGRSWAEYWRAATAHARDSEPDAAAVIRRMSRPQAAPVPEGGPLGNQTFAPLFSGADTSLGFNSYELFTGLQRQANCTLTQRIAARNANYQYSVVQSIPNYEQYLHKISGLTTTPDVFHGGCVDPNVFGATAELVGADETSSGAYVGAYYTYNTINTICVTVVNPVTAAYTATYYTVGYNIGGILAGDFNGDGYIDLAVIGTSGTSYTSSAQISILIANGDGTYKPAVNYAADAAVYGIVSGDFNGDGKTDIYATAKKANGDYELLFFAGNGNGTFKPYVSTDTGATEKLVTWPVDINKDGKLDILSWDLTVSGTTETATLDAMINNGSGAFTPVLSVTDSSFHPLTTGDLNGDGKLDLIYPDAANNTVRVLQGDGTGRFTQKAVYPTVYGPGETYITDIDGDGHPDIVVGFACEGLIGTSITGGGPGQILLGNGDFTFSTPALLQPANSSVAFQAGPRALAVADFNGDGKQDAAVVGINTSTGATLAVTTFLNNGSGSLTAGSTVNFALTGSPFGFGTLIAAPLGTTTANDLLVTGTVSGSDGSAIQSAINNGSGSFTVNPTLLSVPAAVASMVAADFNGDHKADLAYIVNDGNSGPANGLYIALGKGDGTFNTPQLLNGNVLTGGTVYTADLNSDGKPDLVVVPETLDFTAPTALLYINQGTAFAAPVTITLPAGDSSSITDVIAADLNGDGKLDLGLIGTPDNFTYNLYLYTGNGAGSFTASTISDLGDNNPSVGVAADVNHDGIVDLVLSGCCGLAQPSVALGKGAGVFYPAQPFVALNSAASVAPIVLHNANYPDMLFTIYNYGPGQVAPVINHYANASSVAKAATTTAVEGPGTTGQALDLYFTVTVAENSATGQPNGTVTLSLGSKVITTAPVIDGGAYIDIPNNYAPGTYNFTLSYSGDNFNQPSSVTNSVRVIYATALLLTISPSPVPSGDSVTLKAVVSRPLGSGNPTGSVLFFYDGGNIVFGSAPLVNGVATLTQSTSGLPPGTYSLSAGYYGDTNDDDALSPLELVTLVPHGLIGTRTAVTLQPDPITQGQNATVSATVTKASGTGAPTGSVTFYFTSGATTLNIPNVGLNANGVATVTAPTTSLYPGTYFDVYAVYNGNSTTYTSTSDTLSLILRTPTVVNLSATPATVTAGQTVTLNATVPQYNSNPVTGTITFSADGLKLAVVTLKTGTASYSASTTGVAPGTYSVTATYSGDTNYGAASSTIPVTLQ